MITEDYVSYEVAKLLKEKGFNEKCRGCYHYIFDNNDNPIVMLEKWLAQPHNNDFEDETFICSAPTHQMAMKWLREVHNIHIVIKIVIRTYGDTEYYYELYGTKNKSLCVVCDIYKGESWDSSEQACEAAIKYCLENLI